MIELVSGGDADFFQEQLKNDSEGLKWVTYYVSHWESETVNRKCMTILQDSVPVGFVMLTPRGGDVEVDYYVLPEARGKGVGSEAMRLLTQGGFSGERLIAFVNPGNVSSRKALTNANWADHGLVADRIVFTYWLPVFRP